MGRHNEGYRLKKPTWAKCWYITWSEGGRSKRVSTGKTDRKEAEIVLERVRAEIGKDDADDITVSQALEDYMTERAPHIASGATTGYHAKPLHSFLGNDMTADLKPARLLSYQSWRYKAGRKHGTVKRELNVLLAALNHAHKHERIEKVPVIQMPETPEPKDRYLTHDEFGALLSHIHAPHLRLFVLLAIFTGQRKGAILDLTWQQVNLKAGMIDFNPQGRVRTSKGRAKVPMLPELKKALSAVKKRGKYVITYHGRQVADIKKGFKQACTDAGLKDVTPHTLRHTFATWLAQAGTDMWLISKLLGHESIRTTERIYAHHDTRQLNDAMKPLRSICAVKPKTPVENRRKALKG